ncbi:MULTISPECIES: FAD-dependent monooxygenase [unclassified Photorhabdus]|uniref:FAD-dependent monooxygenase n=1 Tax=unclassified Photorhabdus TaxID=2620880 RepID=UPI000DCEC2B6|nr:MULTISPECIES: FAD-dependent monooxygenase [unclassified Photorhabdus]RAW73801.1 FAD-dependent oxidoreductase [Photorhabdus sp. S7-51]RAW75452.1 FAD-dependent oxidoreductase [Photorhabdus sp. S14-60]RAW79530.1 FAD-dependent oxidoreductase [Photorhabdus sp. S15-56]
MLRGITQEYPERPGYGEFVNISQYRIEQELVKLLEANPLCELRWSSEVVGYSQQQDKVKLEVRHCTETETLEFDYVIACDGVRSTLRDLTEVNFTGYTHQDRFLVTDIKANIALTKERHFHFDPQFNPGRQLVMHPQPDNIWRIDWQLPPDADIEAEKKNGQLDKRIKSVIGDIPYQIDWISTYRFNQRVVEKFRLNRLFFAGDAAHSFPPYGSRGMNSGIQDADNLAWKLALVIRGSAGDELLDTYHEERFLAAKENLRLTEATIQFMVPPTPLKQIWRDTVLRISEVWKPLRKQVNHGKMTEPFTYESSSLIDYNHRTPYVGAFSPDVVVYIDGEKSRLRKLFGKGFVCLFCADPNKVKQYLNKQSHTYNGLDFSLVAAVPKGYFSPKVDERLISVTYDDILFFETLTEKQDSLFVIRPDGHLAGHYLLDNAPSLSLILEKVSGTDSLTFQREAS